MKSLSALLAALTFSCAHPSYSPYFSIPSKTVFAGQNDVGLAASSVHHGKKYNCQVESYKAEDQEKAIYLRAEFRCTSDKSSYFSLYELIDQNGNGMIDLECRRHAYDYWQESEVWKQDRVCKPLVESLMY